MLFFFVCCCFYIQFRLPKPGLLILEFFYGEMSMGHLRHKTSLKIRKNNRRLENVVVGWCEGAG